MIPHRLLFVFLVAITYSTAQAQNAAAFEAYIETYAPLAILEMDRTGVPASIKMAQALLESNAGRSELARRANNHFGIKCGNRWQGKSYKKKDDDRHRGRLVKSCFRQFSSVEESFIAHSDFLKNPRYAELFKLRSDDYKAWAKGLRRAGYATNRSYHTKLIALIEQYDLHHLDREQPDRYLAGIRRRGRRAGSDPLMEALPPAAPLVEADVRNDVRCLIPSTPMTAAALAEAGDASLRRILKHNEQIDNREQLLPADQPVYLQPKRKSYRGRDKWHRVEAGQSLLDISITYGIDLHKLHRRNRLEPGQAPAPGERIKLRGGKVKQRPDLYTPPAKEAIAQDRSDEPETALDFVLRPKEEPAPETGATERGPVDPFRPAAADPFAPQAEPAPTAAPAAIYHEVAPGDTLWSIARIHQLSVDELRALNQLENDALSHGMKLRVK